jgi:RNA polymerase sigma-32 factor
MKSDERRKRSGYINPSEEGPNPRCPEELDEADEGIESADNEIVEAEVIGLDEADDSFVNDIEILSSVDIEPVADGRVDGEERGLVRYDSLGAYLREISRIPPMGRDEERELAIQFRRNADTEAARRLVMGNLWLVVRVAREYERAARSLLDLIQEGNIGLMEAVRNFDPDREVRFPSYAMWWIKAYIIRYVIANWKVVKLGTTQAQRKLFFNLNKEKERLQREGFYPSPKLIAEKLNVRESDVIEMEQRMESADVSFEAPLQGDSESSLVSVLPADQLSAEEVVSNKEREKIVSESFAAFTLELNDKELLIFQERLLAEDKATLNDLSLKLGVSKERIRQIENRIKDKLRNFLTNRLGQNLSNLIEDM